MDFNSSKIRFRNIFSTNPDDRLGSTKKLFPVQTGMSNPTPESDGTGNIARASKLLMDTYNEPSPNTERYNQYLESQPSEADYNPSKKRRLGAALLGGALGATGNPQAGISVGTNIVDAPFEDALSDWERKRLPLQNAATSENVSRTQKINALKDYITSEHASQREAESDANVKADNKRADNALMETIADRQAREAETKAEHTRQETNRVADNARADIAFQEIKRHNKQTEDIASRNASISEARANAYKSSVEGLNAYRDHLKEQLKGLKGDSPAAQKTAEEYAHTNVFLKPGNSQKYGDFISQDDKGRLLITPPSKGFFSSDEEFNRQLSLYSGLQNEIKAEKERILRENHTVGNTSTQAPPKVVDKPKVSIVKRERVR